jgi:uncharacterized protein YoxC
MAVLVGVGVGVEELLDQAELLDHQTEVLVEVEEKDEEVEDVVQEVDVVVDEVVEVVEVVEETVENVVGVAEGTVEDAVEFAEGTENAVEFAEDAVVWEANDEEPVPGNPVPWPWP